MYPAVGDWAKFQGKIWIIYAVIGGRYKQTELVIWRMTDAYNSIYNRVKLTNVQIVERV